MPLKKGFKQLLAEAAHKAPGITVQEAQKTLGDAGTVFVDIRDVRELEREGMIPGAFHAPRGMLEFWVDPERWALPRVLHLSGGYSEWRKAGAPTGRRPEKKKTG